MPAFTATAPGKIILFGEHAVVYGFPAIAVPVLSSQARATVQPSVQGKRGEVWIEAPGVSLSGPIQDLDPDHPLRAAVQLAAGGKGIADLPACRILIQSEIPPASGLGSSAAVATALIRALSAFLGKRLDDSQVSDLVFEVEKIQHGTPSGIDNTVVSYRQPIYFRKEAPVEILRIAKPFQILIADSGIPGNTRLAVQGVRDRKGQEPDRYQQIFTQIGEVCLQAREALSTGRPNELGPLMDRNHILLQELGVSTPEMDHLVQAAKGAGALGAKLSGGGLGGHLIALVDDDPGQIAPALLSAGAASAFLTRVCSSS